MDLVSVPPLQANTVPAGVVFGTNMVGQTWIEGKRYVVLKLDDPTGSKVACLEPEAAKALATNLRAAASGLSLANGSIHNEPPEET